MCNGYGRKYTPQGTEEGFFEEFKLKTVQSEIKSYNPVTDWCANKVKFDNYLEMI